MVTLLKSTEKVILKEDNDMLFQEIYESSIETPKCLARSLNKIIRRKINTASMPNYIDFVNSEFVYSCSVCEKAYVNLEKLLKNNYRLTPCGKTKSATIIYAHFRITESFALFQRVKDAYTVNRNYKKLITALKTIRQQLRSIYVCKY